MAYTITTGLVADMTEAVDKNIKHMNNTTDRAIVKKAFDDLIAVLFIEFTAVDTGA